MPFDNKQLDLFNVSANSAKPIDVSIAAPIPALSIDSSRLKKTLHLLKVIPKFRTSVSTAFSYLNLLKRIAKESETHNACLDLVDKYGFKGSIDIQYADSQLFSFMEAKEPSLNEKIGFVEDVQTLGLGFDKIKELTPKLRESYINMGDAYLYVNIKKVLDKFIVNVNFIDFDEFMYLDEQDSKGRNNFGIWAKSWDRESVIDKKKYIQSAVTDIRTGIAKWSKNGNGTSYSTIIHWKNGDTTDLYGKVPIEGIKNQLYLESKSSENLTKLENSLLTAQFIYASAQDIDKVDDEQAARNLKYEKETLNSVGTVKGENPDSMLLLKYYPDDRPQLFKLDYARDTNFAQYKDEKAETAILKFHTIGKDIIEAEQTRTGFSSDAELIKLFTFNQKVIEPAQSQMEAFWGLVFKVIGKAIGNESMATMTVKFEDKTSKIVDFIKELSLEGKGAMIAQGAKENIKQTKEEDTKII
jgi:hypothetical protein